MSDNRKGCPYGLCVIIGLRFFVLQKIVRVRIPLTICKKIKGYSKCYTLYFLAESKGFFRRTAVCLRIASLFNHGLSNSPPDCFHRRSRPSLFESLAVLSTKNKGYSKRYTLYSLAESKGFFRRTAVRLRIASLFNHGLSNSPPDCFRRQSRPALFESLAVLSTKNKGYSKCYTLYFLAESKGFEPSKPFWRFTRFPIVLLRPARTTLRVTCDIIYDCLKKIKCELQ